jgi:capsular exopolysaccharide synthesis family protein
MLDRLRANVTGATAQAGEGHSDAIDLRQIQDFLWRRWKLILSTAAVIATVTYIALLVVTPRYTATAQVLLDPGSQKLLGAANLIPELSLDSGNVDSQVSLIRSTNLLRRVVETTKLTQDPEFGAAVQPGLFALLKSWIFPAAETEPNAAPGSSDAIPPDVLRAIGRLRDALEVSRVERTYVISIGVTSEVPAKAALLANAVADAYVVDQLNARYEAAKTASNWLAQRMEGMREQVKQSEEAVANFRREHGLVTTSSEGKLTINEQQLSELNGKLVTARAETAARRAAYEQAVQLQQRGGSLQTVSEVVSSPVIGQLRKQQADAAQKIAELASRYNNDHPLMVRARAELRDVNNSIAAETGRIITNLKNEYDVAKAREDSMQKSLDQISGASGLDNSVGIQLRELERNNAANKTLFESFLSQAKVTSAQSTFDVRDSRIISPASKPGAPSFPKKRLVLSLAAVIGLLIGIGGGVALDMLNSGFTTHREIEEKLNIPVLASIPMLTTAELTVNGKLLDPPLYCHTKPLSRYAEAVRTLRMGVQMADVDDPAKVVLITSSIPQESKSTIVLSLAYSAIKAGLRTVIIDCDLRHPTVSKYFGLEKSAGLVDLLAGTVTAEQTFVSKGGLTIVPAGSKSQNPPDLLGSARMKGLVDKLRENYDYVIIDTPPVGPVIDAKVAMALADKVIFAVRWQSTTREMVAQSIDGLNAGRKLAGIVLGVVDESKVPRYGRYSYYSSYHYKSYYQS